MKKDIEDYFQKLETLKKYKASIESRDNLTPYYEGKLEAFQIAIELIEN